MNTRVNAMLEDVRKDVDRFVEQVGTTAMGVATAGEGGAENGSDIDDVIDAYFSEMVESLQGRYDISDDDAIELIWDTIQVMLDDGDISMIPSDTAPAKDWAEFIGNVKTAGLHFRILQAAAALATDEGEDE